MGYKSKKAESVPQDEKLHECFVCNAKSAERGLPLLVSETTWSHICLGEKLQEILAGKYVILVNPNDGVCWDCAMCINQVDRYEQKLDLLKDHLVMSISAKYKHKVKIPLDAFKEPSKEDPVKKEPIEETVKDVAETESSNGTNKKSEKETKNSKGKTFQCRFCAVIYLNESALLSHMLQKHPPKFLCHICDSSFSNETRYHAHLIQHLSKKPTTKRTRTRNSKKHTCAEDLIATCTLCKNKRTIASKLSSVEAGVYKCKECFRIKDESTPDIESTENGSFIAEDQSMLFQEAAVEAETHCEEKEVSQGLEEAKQVVEEVTRCEEEVTRGEEEVSPGPVQINGVDVRQEEDYIDEEGKEEGAVVEPVTSYLRCNTCGDQFELANLTSHSCFLDNRMVECLRMEEALKEGGGYSTTSAVYLGDDEDYYKRLETTYDLRCMSRPGQACSVKCRMCNATFPDTSALREHWQMTGHSSEAESDHLVYNVITDKASNRERTFKVVKQKFIMKANMATGEDKEALREETNAHLKDMFVKLSNTFKCTLCNIDFPTEASVEEHRQSNCLTCITCSVTFLNEKLLKKHYSYTGHSRIVGAQGEGTKEAVNDSGAHKYRCNLCTKISTSRFMLSKHLACHYKGTAKGACHYCLEEFADKADIQQHVLEAHGAKLYKCEHCDRTFLSQKFRDLHQLKHNKETFPCLVCKLNFPTQRMLVYHNEQIHREMACRICGKNIHDLQMLYRHEKRHYYNKGLQCGLCLKTFKNKGALEKHSKGHIPGDFKVECEICHRGFASAASLEEHRITHVKQKYTCGVCGQRCASRTQYWVHTKMHDNPYKCGVCGRIYRDTSLLAVHRRKHWRVRPYRCPHCTRTFSVPATLRRHLTKHTLAYPHRCAVCRRGFLTRYVYHRHLAMTHGIRKTPDTPRPHHAPRVPSLPLSVTDEDLFHAADTLIADESVMFVDYSGQDSQVPSSELISNEVVVETTELFDQLLH